ncbi:hypothetical protein [Enterococcus gallinarum]|uniref:hypothetical protein n=1 Tax=Enterococcus gallinarum TaxID=1353 RepID=UPI0035144578
MKKSLLMPINLQFFAEQDAVLKKRRRLKQLKPPQTKRRRKKLAKHFLVTK